MSDTDDFEDCCEEESDAATLRYLDGIAHKRHSALRAVCEALSLPTSVLGDDASEDVVVCAEIRRLRVLAGNPHPLDYDALERATALNHKQFNENYALTAKLRELMSPDDFHKFMWSLEPEVEPLTEDEADAFTEFMRTR